MGEPPQPEAYATIGWERLHADSRALAARLLPGAPYAGIVAVSRGGLVPAAVVARELECRLVETVCVRAYAAEVGTGGEPVLLSAPASAGEGDGWVVVDDLVDTGSTARLVRALLPRARFVCLYAKPAGRGFADLFVAEFPQTTWLLFPWDTAPGFVPPLARPG